VRVQTKIETAKINERNMRIPAYFLFPAVAPSPVGA
jgi:hypothetical protein